MGYKRGGGPGACWGELFGAHLGSLLFGSIWAHFLFVWGPLGPIWGPFYLGPIGPVWGPFYLGPLGPIDSIGPIGPIDPIGPLRWNGTGEPSPVE